jgi:LPXTG-site transpeptidase (sortase) family protein
MKAIRLLTAILILNSLFTSPVLAKNYSDVSYDYKHFQAITDLSDRNVIKGYNNGEFHPDGLINRAEAVKILVESKFDDEIINHSLDWHKQSNHWYVMFPDVKITDWFGSYVEMGCQNKIIQGYPDGNFHPADNINFAEALKIILLSYGVNTHETEYKSNPLLYIKKGDWFEPYFTYAYEYNLINQNKFYHPAQLITRGEFAEIVYRLETVAKMKLPEFITDKQPASNEYKITIPKLNIIDLQVSLADPHNENAALNVLKKGLGQYLSPPSAGKKIIIFGHSSGYSWDNSPYKTILRRINTLQNGDNIYINYQEKGYIYEIFKSDIIPANEDYRLVEDKNNNELALYTCWPPNQIGHRYVVYGRPVS